MSRIELLQEISAIIIDSSKVAIVEWWLREGDGYFRCQVSSDRKGGVRWEADNLDVTHPDEGIIVGTREQQALNRIYLGLIGTEPSPATERLTSHGSFWACDQCRETSPALDGSRSPQHFPLKHVPDSRCFILVPLRGGDEDLGFISLKAERDTHFSREQLELYELVSEAVAVALVHQDAQAKLRERVKELGCLYEVVRLADNPELSLDRVLQGVANLLPSAWQYPKKAAGRVVLDERAYCTRGFTETVHVQSAAIVVGGEERGSIDVVYLEDRPRMHEGPFLKEERHLIDALAREVSLIIERRQAREEKKRLEDQLRHADRLATIGQLAAGVAHELNEPLGNILGFAQLAEKADGLPDKARRDITKIIEACLFSRKVVSKLKLFARQMPAQRATIDLNRMITEELFFIESRCAKQGVDLRMELDPALPSVEADPGQIYQVLVNLAVNAVQAMPDGGVLTIHTRNLGDRVALGVADTGVGMTQEVKSKIFVPFYTTKDVDQGTGLGLSVVHGIVAAHGGTINVVTAPRAGSIFEVCLPVGVAKETSEDGTP